MKKPCTATEIAQLLQAAEHELAHAADPAADRLTRYSAATQAELKLAAFVLRAFDYESSPTLDPDLTIQALPDPFGPEGRGSAKLFVAHYRKSRRRSGTKRQGKLERSLEELLRQAATFRGSVLDWLGATRRHLLPGSPTGGEGMEGE